MIFFIIIYYIPSVEFVSSNNRIRNWQGEGIGKNYPFSMRQCLCRLTTKEPRKKIKMMNHWHFPPDLYIFFYFVFLKESDVNMRARVIVAVLYHYPAFR